MIKRYFLPFSLTLLFFQAAQAEDQWAGYDRSLVCTEGAIGNDFEAAFTWPVYTNYQNIVSDLAKGKSILDPRCARKTSTQGELIISEGPSCTLIDQQDVVGQKYEARLRIAEKVKFRRKSSNGIDYLVVLNPEAVSYSFGRLGHDLYAGNVTYICARVSPSYASDILMQYAPTKGDLKFVDFLQIK